LKEEWEEEDKEMKKEKKKVCITTKFERRDQLVNRTIITREIN
jgi:hypothetical protein